MNWKYCTQIDHSTSDIIFLAYACSIVTCFHASSMFRDRKMVDNSKFGHLIGEKFLFFVVVLFYSFYFGTKKEAAKQLSNLGS